MFSTYDQVSPPSEWDGFVFQWLQPDSISSETAIPTDTWGVLRDIIDNMSGKELLDFHAITLHSLASHLYDYDGVGGRNPLVINPGSFTSDELGNITASIGTKATAYGTIVETARQWPESFCSIASDLTQRYSPLGTAAFRDIIEASLTDTPDKPTETMRYDLNLPSEKFWKLRQDFYERLAHTITEDPSTKNIAIIESTICSYIAGAELGGGDEVTFTELARMINREFAQQDADGNKSSLFGVEPVQSVRVDITSRQTTIALENIALYDGNVLQTYVATPFSMALFITEYLENWDWTDEDGIKFYVLDSLTERSPAVREQIAVAALNHPDSI
ncbi:MAG: hypothetical protein WBP26_02045 [Candidatus Saccharimonadales bacterium]